MTSELSAGWWTPAVEPTLRRLPDQPPQEVAEAHTSRGQSDVPDRGLGVTTQPATTRQQSSGLKTRLVIVDIAAIAATWLVLGAVVTAATTMERRWGAALAASAVTLVSMRLLGLYRSRLCVQRGQESVRIVVAAMAGAVTFELLEDAITAPTVR